MRIRGVIPIIVRSIGHVADAASVGIDWQNYRGFRYRYDIHK